MSQNAIQVFNFQENYVRTVQQNDETWFVLKDVCDVLELANSRDVTNRLDEDEVGLTDIIDNLGRNQKTNIINESGLYSVILRSDKPNAKPFRKWVTSIVIPSIRKTGSYSVNKAPESNFSAGKQIAELQQRLIETQADLIQVLKQKQPFSANASFINPNSRILITNKILELYNEGMPYKDIATAVNKSVKSIYDAIKYARKHGRVI